MDRGVRGSRGMRPRRVRLISLDELCVRGRQEASTWLERTGAITLTGGRPPAFRVERVSVLGSRRFFGGAVSERPPGPIDRTAAVRDEIVETANAACRGRFDLLGYSRLSFGDPVDWQLDPISGRRAPFSHWSRLNVLDAAEGGDHKVVWGLNRHQWLLAPGQGYHPTGGERFRDALAPCA